MESDTLNTVVPILGVQVAQQLPTDSALTTLIIQLLIAGLGILKIYLDKRDGNNKKSSGGDN